MSRRSLGVTVLLVAATLAGCAGTNWEAVAGEHADELRAKEAQLELMGAENAKAIAESEAAKNRAMTAERDAQLRTRQAEEAATRAREWQQVAEQAKRDAAAKPIALNEGAPSAGNEAAERKADELRKKGFIANVTHEGNIDVTLPSDVNFGSGKSALSDAGKKSLKTLGSLLNGEFAPYMVRVEGHTDSTPLNKTKKDFTDNFGLGSARALEVVRFMTSEMKIDAKRLMSASRGEQQPVATGAKPADLAKNRRVEIVVVIPRDAAIAEAK